MRGDCRECHSSTLARTQYHIIVTQGRNMAFEICWYEQDYDIKSGNPKKIVRTGVFNFSNKFEAEKAREAAHKISGKYYFVRQHNAR